MSYELPKGKIYIVGTMRTGSSVITNMLNAHSKIMILGEYIHFFRFIYKYNFYNSNIDFINLI